jgi:hypothetical protein
LQLKYFVVNLNVNLLLVQFQRQHSVRCVLIVFFRALQDAGVLSVVLVEGPELVIVLLESIPQTFVLLREFSFHLLDKYLQVENERLVLLRVLASPVLLGCGFDHLVRCAYELSEAGIRSALRADKVLNHELVLIRYQEQLVVHSLLLLLLYQGIVSVNDALAPLMVKLLHMKFVEELLFHGKLGELVLRV